MNQQSRTDAPLPDGAPAVQCDVLLDLLQADSAEALAAALLDALPAQEGARVTWSAEWPQDIHRWPASDADDADAVGERVLCDDGEGAMAMLQGPADWLAAASPPLLEAAGRRLRELLGAHRLRASLERLGQAERLQHALFAIADMAGSEHDMPSLLKGLHEIIGRLMYAENFYIALYDSARDSLRFAYFVDTDETAGPELGAEIPLADIERGLTWYLIHDRKSMKGSGSELARQVSGPLLLRGADSLDWLGVPMLRDGQVRGALVVQNYRYGNCYSERDQALLAFVAEHVLTALERKQAQAELEQRVAERTRQLAEANADLHQQVLERLRGEHLQATLYQIAALANADDDSERFYRHIHQAVGELINAENFYIGLLDDDGEGLEFPYSVDARDQRRPPRPLGRGLSEYVIRTGKPLLADRERLQQLSDTREIAPRRGSPSLCWLGVPLQGNDGVIGLVAVQSYRTELTYDADDLELLTFVSYQIASSLQRRRSAEALLQLNAQLEHRVDARTRELREQITVREQVEAQLKHQIMHDPLTGLPNRLYMRDRVERALAGLRRHPDRPFALLYLDVDRFKLFNDSLGHQAGDEVLREVSRRLGHCIREPDVVARLSGDEFAILLEDVPVPQTACKVAQRVQEALQQPMQVAGRELQTSASIGIALGDERYHNTDELFHDADTALYRAKSAGRQRFVLFDDTLQQAAMDVLGIEHELRAALTDDRQLLPHFQPLVRIEDGHVMGYEALIRWQHPQRGLLLPAAFLPVAEDSGLIEAMDWLMYRRALAQGAALVRDGGFITLNISPRHFQNADFDARLLEVAAEAGFNPAQLRIEVTEGTLLGDPDTVHEVLDRLRAACVEAALDDFGTGYSSLGYVHRFPLKMIKIDRSFVDPIGQTGRDGDQRSSAVIGAIIALAGSLGLDVVAEGVETPAQCKALAGMGCRYAQGYLFGRPAAATHWLPPAS